MKIWIIKNQLGRRNLSAYDRSILALKLKPVIAAQAKENSLANLKQNTDVKNSSPRIEITPTPKPAREQKTNYQVAQAAGVSEDTIRKVEKIEAQATPEIKAALRTGDLSINAAYTKVKQAERKEDIQRQVEEIEQRAIEKPDGLFDVIVIDPPWAYGDGNSYRVDGWRVAAPYPEMTQDELKAIKLPAALRFP